MYAGHECWQRTGIKRRQQTLQIDMFKKQSLTESQAGGCYTFTLHLRVRDKTERNHKGGLSAIPLHLVSCHVQTTTMDIAYNSVATSNQASTDDVGPSLRC
jgi:hypothetical protein